MGPQYSFILAKSSVDPSFWRRVISGLETEINLWLGPLKTVSVQSYLNDSTQDSMVRRGASQEIPDLSETEIATFYPAEPRGGCLMLSREGRFLVVAISLKHVQDPIDILRKCWQKIGNELSLALAGEELEVSEYELDFLSNRGIIPEEADLCEAAIVKIRNEARVDRRGTDVQHGAVLIRKF